MAVKPHIACRVCEAGDLVQYLDLGTQAPANALRSPTDTSPEFDAPLSVSWCPACGLSQLDHVVDPHILYANYPFRAGASQKWRTHCVELVNAVQSPGRRFLIDIGSNDGVLLEEAHARGWKVLGVDPCPVGKLPSLEQLWSERAGGSITRFHGQADVITATNVFGHVDDAKDFLSGIAIALKPAGKAVIECPHLIPLLEQTAFDTIYHEHLSYWSLRPLEMLAESVGLRVVDVRLFDDLHGGTMRYVLTPGDNRTKVTTRVTRLRMHESVLFKQGIAPYRDFAQRAQAKIQQFRETLVAQRRAGKRIWGYGASAKGNVLLQAACLSNATVERIVDDAESKWGFLTPGTHIPITNANDLSEPDILVLLSWNNANDLMVKAQSHGFRGQFMSLRAA
jgi:novobiocin biosynthesis protein NovU/D-mycarose 3-C-methyltransferase